MYETAIFTFVVVEYFENILSYSSLPLKLVLFLIDDMDPPVILPPSIEDIPPPGVALVEELDKLLMVQLRDGRKILGVLRSFDQFANLVLESMLFLQDSAVVLFLVWCEKLWCFEYPAWGNMCLGSLPTEFVYIFFFVQVPVNASL